MKRKICPADTNGGYIIVVIMLLLALLSLAGLTANRRGVSDLAVASNRQSHELSFQAADSGIHYVAGREDELYGDLNTTPDAGLRFPNATEGLISMPGPQALYGWVYYRRASDAPRGAGYEVGKFDAQWYDCDTCGCGPRSSESTVVVRFYRISPSNLGM